MEIKVIGDLLKEWRGIRGVSQMTLALDAEVSPRHVSFLESGRSRPSQDMVLRLAEALGVPLRERNAMLVAAGFAPQFGDSDAESEELSEVRQAIAIILAGHDPSPAVALDGAFDIIDTNQGFDSLRALAGIDRPTNLVDMVLTPGPIREAVENWDDVAGYLMHRMRERTRSFGPSERLKAVMSRAMRQPGIAEIVAAPRQRIHAAMLPVKLNIGGQRSSWITTVTTFGAPQDAFVEELTIEQFYPAA